MSRVDEARDEQIVEITWLEIALVVGVVALMVQLFPTMISTSADIVWIPLRFLFNLCDIRQWTWRSYAVANVLAFVSLGVMRMWKGQG